MKKEDEYLSVFRELENTLRNRGVEYRTLEDETNGKDKNRLKICRTIRNYLVHNDDAGFICVTDMQIEFLTNKIIEASKKYGDTVQQNLIKVNDGVAFTSDKCTDTISKFIKYKTNKILVCEKRGLKIVGVATIQETSKEMVKSKSAKMSSVKTINDYIIVDIGENYNNIPPDTIAICTEDGTPHSKVKGVIIK